MHEIVDLISSDNEFPFIPSTSFKRYKPSTSIAPTATAASKTTVPRRNVDADFDLTLDDEDDFPWHRKVKRRKHDSMPPIDPTADLEPGFEIQQNAQPEKKTQSRGSISTAAVDDDIICTSPAQQKPPDSICAAIEGLDELSECSPAAKKGIGLSSKTAALLKEISANPVRKKSRRLVKDKAEEIQDDENSSPTNDDGRLPKNDLQEKAEQARQRQEKALEKEAAKQMRAEARISKAAEKQRAADLAAVNRSRMDKNVTTPEMIVDFPISMERTSSLTQCREFLRKANSETNLYTSEIAGIIKFRRKIMADFNDELDYMVRVEPRVDDENMILLYLPAEEFACLVSPFTPQDETLEGHLARARGLHPNYRIIYLIEGLERLIAKEKNASNRAYQAAVRRAAAAEKDQQATPSTDLGDRAQAARKPKNKNSPVIVDEVAIEAALLLLQIEHSVQIHQCITPLDVGETVLAMTQQLSLSRYRDPPSLTATQMALQPNFCMSTGQVSTGRDVNDTYLKMLQQVIRVTEREARAISKTHPHLGALFAAFRSGGGKVLEGIMKEGGGAKGINNGGPATERRIGPATSERLFRIFLGSNPAEMVG